LAVHAGVLALGVLTYHSVKALLHPQQVQAAPADTGLVVSSMANGLNDGFRGSTADPFRASVQDQIKDAAAEGASWSPGGERASLRSWDVGARTEAESDTLIGVSPHPGRSRIAGVELGDPGGGPASFGVAARMGGAPNIFRSGLLSGGHARSVVFLCDASGSMLAKFDALKRELSKAIQSLKPTQSFSIHFFSDTRSLSLSGPLLVATPGNKLRATEFLETVAPRGTTDPLPALDLAFRQKPQLVFLLTDGDFPDNEAVLSRIRQLNHDRRAKIDTIAFVDKGDTDTAFIALLKRIAAENGGAYRHVTQDEVQ
jgi:Mg-chelatase subunit ChlD